MNRRTIVIGISLALAGYIILLILAPRPKEPVYKGKRLSYWLDHLSAPPERLREPEQAIIAIGTNGIPFYLQWLAYNPTKARKYIWRFFGDKNWARRADCERAFELLGSRAEEAIPELARLLTNAPSSDAFPIAFCLAHIGRKAVPALASATTNHQRNVRLHAGEALSRLGPDAWLAAPTILSLMDGAGGSRLFVSAAEALVAVNEAPPEVILPAILAGINDPEAWVRSAALAALTNTYPFEIEAMATNSLAHWDTTVRMAATNVLIVIRRYRHEDESSDPSRQ